MPPTTKVELEQVVEQLTAENEILKAKVLELQEQMLQRGAGPGWIVYAPSPKYNERTKGIQFRHGRAFVPEVEGAKAVVDDLVNDFHYKAEHVQSWDELPTDEKDTLQKSMIDVVQMPEVIGAVVGK